MNLVSDQVGRAALRDTDLVNAWGLALGPTTPLWVANNHTATSTIYSGGGVGHPITKQGLTVSIPGGAPTGQVFNGTSGFKLKDGSPAKFIFASESGHITAWNGGLTPITMAVTVSSTTNANYKGLALLRVGHHEWLLASDFRHKRVQVFNSRFHKVSSARGRSRTQGSPRATRRSTSRSSAPRSSSPTPSKVPVPTMTSPVRTTGSSTCTRAKASSRSGSSGAVRSTPHGE